MSQFSTPTMAGPQTLRRLLVINPNTSSHITDLLHAHAMRSVGEGVQVQSITARFGAAYISCEASYAVAAHATLDAWAAAVDEADGREPDAVLVACFGDPGLLALRDNCTASVTGLAEASFVEAAKYGRFGIVTGGERWKPMLQRLAQSLGYGDSLVGIETVSLTGGQLAENPEFAHELLGRACSQMAAQHDVQAIILGGAALAGMARIIQPMLAVPVIDSVAAGMRYALEAPRPQQGKTDAGPARRWLNVSPELQRHLL